MIPTTPRYWRKVFGRGYFSGALRISHIVADCWNLWHRNALIATGKLHEMKRKGEELP